MSAATEGAYATLKNLGPGELGSQFWRGLVDNKG